MSFFDQLDQLLKPKPYVQLEGAERREESLLSGEHITETRARARSKEEINDDAMKRQLAHQQRFMQEMEKAEVDVKKQAQKRAEQEKKDAAMAAKLAAAEEAEPAAATGKGGKTQRGKRPSGGKDNAKTAAAREEQETAEALAAVAAAEAAEASASATGTGGLPAGWEEVPGPGGRVFYVNHELQRTQWERPGGANPPIVPPRASAVPGVLSEAELDRAHRSLSELGFEAPDIDRALRETQNVDRAIEYLLQHPESPPEPTPVVVAEVEAPSVNEAGEPVVVVQGVELGSAVFVEAVAA